jgi:hypothetical protein
MKHLLPLLCCVGLLTALTGCNSRSGQTGLSIEAVRLVHGANGTVTVDLVLLNPSVVAFNIASSKHTLYLNGREAGRIVIKEPSAVAAENQTSFSAPLLVDKAAVLPAEGRVSYRLETELELRLYGDSVEYAKLASLGTLTVVGK